MGLMGLDYLMGLMGRMRHVFEFGYPLLFFSCFNLV